MDKQQLASTVNKVLDEMRQRPIPIGISSRHIHLAAADYARLFPAQPIQPKKALLQPGQYAAEQTVTLVGPKGRLNNVRLLGPLRQTSRWKSHAPTPGSSVSPRRCACPAICRARRGSA